MNPANGLGLRFCLRCSSGFSFFANSALRIAISGRVSSRTPAVTNKIFSSLILLDKSTIISGPKMAPALAPVLMNPKTRLLCSLL